MATEAEVNLCQDILALGIAINMTSNYSAWVELHGHVDGIEVRISPKWKMGAGTEDLPEWSVFSDHNNVKLSTNYKLARGELMKDVIAYKVEKLEKLKASMIEFLNKEVA